MKSDAKCNETTPAILFDRCHEDSEILTKIASESWYSTTQIVKLEKTQGQVWNQRPVKRTGPL